MDNYPSPMFSNCAHIEILGSAYNPNNFQCRFCCQQELCKKWYDLDRRIGYAKDDEEPKPIKLPKLIFDPPMFN